MSDNEIQLKILSSCKEQIKEIKHNPDAIELVESCIKKLKQIKNTSPLIMKESLTILCKLYSLNPENNNNETHLKAWIELLAYYDKPIEICKKLFEEKKFNKLTNFFICYSKHIIKNGIIEAFNVLKSAIELKTTPQFDINIQISNILKKYLLEIEASNNTSTHDKTNSKLDNNAPEIIEFPKGKPTKLLKQNKEILKWLPYEILCYTDNEYCLEELLAVRYFINNNICTDDNPNTNTIIVTREHLDNIPVYFKKLHDEPVDPYNQSNMLIDSHNSIYTSMIIEHKFVSYFEKNKAEEYSVLFTDKNKISKYPDYNVNDIQEEIAENQTIREEINSENMASAGVTNLTPYSNKIKNESPTPTLATKCAKNLIEQIFSKPLLSDNSDSFASDNIHTVGMNNNSNPIETQKYYNNPALGKQASSPLHNEKSYNFNESNKHSILNKESVQKKNYNQDLLGSFEINTQTNKIGQNFLQNYNHSHVSNVFHEKLIDFSDDIHNKLSRNDTTNPGTINSKPLKVINNDKDNEDYTIGISRVPLSLHSTPNQINKKYILKELTPPCLSSDNYDNQLEFKLDNFYDHPINYNSINGLNKLLPEQKISNINEINPFDRSIIKSWLNNLKHPVRECQNYHYLPQLDLSIISKGEKLELKDWTYNVISKIGSGGFADIYRCTPISNQSNEDIVLKIQKVNLIAEWEFYIINELNIRNRTNYLDVLLIKSSTSFGLILQYCPSITLLDLSNKMKSPMVVLEESVALVICCKLIELVVLCHSNDIIHGDFKPDNILVMRNSNSIEFKLIDFGRSIDLRLCASNIMFKAKSNTEDFECLEMRSNLPWKYEVDYFGLIASFHVFIFQSYMKPVKTKDDIWKITSSFKRSWNRKFWNDLFDLFLVENIYRSNGTNLLKDAFEMINGRLKELSAIEDNPYIKAIKFINSLVD